MEKLSGVIITKNEAQRISACLAALSFCDEIVVVDSGSTDATVSVAEQAGARVIHQDWLGFGPQKQFAVEQASHDWVLCVDADELVSAALKTSIQKALESPAHVAYRFPRCNRFLGRWLRHGEGYPDLSLRLFDRRRSSWSKDLVHEKVEVQGSVGELAGDLMHESQETISAYLLKQDRYTSLQAEELFRRGKSASVIKLTLSPFFRFVRFYFIRLGFLDGLPGLVHILIGCQNSFFKYAKLLELHREKSAS